MAESIAEGTLKTWTKQVGDKVEADEEVATIETDKIDVSVNAPRAGRIIEVLASEEDTVRVGQALFRIEYGEFEGEFKSEESQPEQPKSTKHESEAPNQHVDKSIPPPAKPESTVEMDTAKLTPEKKEFKPAPKLKEEPRSAPAPGNRSETRVKISRLRLRIAERLKESQCRTSGSVSGFQLE